MRLQSVAFSLTITLCLALAAAGLAYVGGQAAADPTGQYEHGVADGQRQGRAQARVEFIPGSDAYEAVLDKGRKLGFAAGRRAGRRDAAPTARARGINDAFGSFPGGWDVGHWYVVNIRPGEGGALYAIGARVPVREHAWYGICHQVEICRRSR
jgi:hypothetical protein